MSDKLSSDDISLSSADGAGSQPSDLTQDAIRRLMFDVETEAEPDEIEATAEPIPVKVRQPERAAFESLDASPHAELSDDETPTRFQKARIYVANRVRQFLRRPDAPRWLAIAVLAAIVFWQPWYIVFLFFLTCLLALVVYLTLGHERIIEFGESWYERLQRRDPERADALRRRAAKVSAKVTSLIERLPEKWTWGIYLPDFNETTITHEKMKSDPFDRLAAQIAADKAR